MDIKDTFLIIIAFLGWSWGIIQYIINRKLQKKDKQSDRRFDAYSDYMKKSDKIMNSVRTDTKEFLKLYTDYMSKILSGDGNAFEDLAEFNEKIMAYVNKATDPYMILKNELNTFRIICSEKLSSYIEEFNLLVTDYNNEVQKSLSLMSPNDSNNMIRQLETLGHDERWKRFESLNSEIIAQMRIEIGTR